MSETDAAFDALCEEFCSVWFRYHPDVAAETGARDSKACWRDLLMRRQGSGFMESLFHDRLLSRGRIPLPLILGADLGEHEWREIAECLGT